MSGIQRVGAIVALIIVALAIVFALMPFTFADSVSCGPALLGSKPRTTETIGLTQPQRDCERTGRSRLATAGVMAIVAVATGAGISQIQPPGKDCREGRHGDCHGGWPALVGARRFACPCSCH
ncbi:MAG: hypothetical protein KY447_10880 [Actinobacteria bacterium]|nr:hypothetical protein [Actinomycetota bacterium]MBW3643407.1 hypothetical protein [Actinomycetota bacterium]